jgi:hypothetical protein
VARRKFCVVPAPSAEVARNPAGRALQFVRRGQQARLNRAANAMARRSHFSIAVKRSLTIGGSVVLATAVGLALLLRPRPVAREALPASVSLPPAARQVVRSRMVRHEAQMKTLVSRVVLLDDDGIARAAGEIFDDPALAGPVAGDELNGLLPERFFALQHELRARARGLVTASSRHDRDAVADEFGRLAKGCISCHEVFVHGDTTRLGEKETHP